VANPPRITRVRLVPAPGQDREKGLIGWLSFRLPGGLLIDGVTLRRTLDGRLALSFPARRDGRGAEHPILRPVSAEVRAAIERQVLEQLGYLNGEGAA